MLSHFQSFQIQTFDSSVSFVFLFFLGCQTALTATIQYPCLIVFRLCLCYISILFNLLTMKAAIDVTMMLGVIRRRFASCGSSVSVFRQSLPASQPVVSTSRVSSIAEKEVLLQPRGSGQVRNFGHLVVPGCSGSLRPMREVVASIQWEATMQMLSRPFSSDNGDLVDAVVPFMGESITDGTLASFLKNPGDRVEVDEPIAQIETDKVTIDVTSPEAGVIQKFVAKEGDTVEPGTKIAIISKSAEGVAPVAPSEKASEKAVSQPSPPSEKSEEKQKPKVETAPVTAKPKAPSTPPPKHSATEPQLPPKERERRVPMTRLRKRVANRLKDSQNTFALLTTFNEVDMTNLMKLRSDYKDAFVEKHGVKLGLMSGFVKAAVSGLQNQPIINAVIDGDDIIYRDYVDISIAVGTPKGLVVPVIRNAEKMNFAEIEKEINTLAKKANDGSISIDEMAGGSFTISNGGVYGSLLSTPIINPPQSAILGMHSIVSRPMVVGGNVVPRPMMYIALTYDHRLIDGREAVFFLRRIKDVVEDPRRLLLDI
ncbi:dihydrolipoyllysine-residue succinyltransferase component of 2-oxoglutarate dehydrogenase complex 2, mitochondrial isoform X2 [Quercus robur]|uniref:dihydrolipoyllysine-residue succinyltransferase component of 2-oxoglutarate dehydrogenase complex 2, mitochondrial isoform X2 n=2 Tax=Quercus robur TaxID=38942 RepID=UPI002161DF13|nr:dihydrolipoyllysine-residue succinyltransferase component of 2-oxoglutarate dehydrogenase complex 2, mitochondrial isoform X2 [Quercus robur]